MVRQLTGRPVGSFEVLKHPALFTFWEGHDNRRTYAEYAVRWGQHEAELHAAAREWGPRMVANMKADFEEFRRLCREKRIGRIVTLCNGVPSDKWVKFCQRFGFGPAKTITYMEQEV